MSPVLTESQVSFTWQRKHPRAHQSTVQQCVDIYRILDLDFKRRYSLVDWSRQSNKLLGPSVIAALLVAHLQRKPVRSLSIA